MRAIPEGLAASLAGPVTTLARCWRLTRADGTILAFTDHDEALEFEATRFAAASGLSAGEAETALGLGTGTQEVEGALSADALREEDIAAGLYDGARVESFLVDWRRPERHLRLTVSTVGEIRRSGRAFTAELRGPEAALDRQRGRAYRRGCDAAFGDSRCGLDLVALGLKRMGAVLAGDRTRLTLGGLGELDPSAFTGGRLRIGDGPACDIARLEANGSSRIVTLDEPLAALPEPGQEATILGGCDKSFATCRDRFANAENFRGFPHLPGLDAVLSLAKRDDVHDGAPLVP